MTEPFRRTPEGIATELPPELRRWLVGMARQAADDAVSIGDPVHRRLLGPIDPTADHDDPVSELQRQFAVEGSLERFIATSDDRVLTEEDAEEWIRSLQLMLAAAAARHAVRSDEDMAGLAEEDAAALTTLQAAISLLLEALEA